MSTTSGQLGMRRLKRVRCPTVHLAILKRD
jgi:hypothetical protein